ncbi:MAG: nitrite reductase [Deltaproteobacteria bacterium]|nr:nitrite reductase [Deltaproteobacteria bacterium]
MITEKSVSLTVLLPAGQLPLDVMETAHHLAKKHGFGIYLSTAQNLRLINVPESDVETVKTTLKKLDVEFKAPGKFPLPRVCVGKGHCNLGITDTDALSQKILDKFSGRKKTKAKFKIAIAACACCCSNPKTTDIGIISTRNGYQLFAGGKGGLSPKVGRRFAKNADDSKILECIETLVDYHDKKTKKKQRMYKLIDAPDFPLTVL